MAIEFKEDELESFFGCAGQHEDMGLGFKRSLTYDFQGNPLIFSVMIHIDNEYVGISGDTERPFGGDSLFEFYIPADRITYYSYGGYDKGCPMLSFTYGDESYPNYRTMSLHKSPNQKLKVWPVYAFPKGHFVAPRTG